MTETSPVCGTGAATRDLLTFRIANQLIGVSLLEVRDVLDQRQLTPIPLAPPEVAGALNLRGRILTAIETRTRLGIPPREPGSRHMSIVVEQEGELYNLLVDKVGDVLHLTEDQYEPNPATLDGRWRELCDGVFRLEGELLAVLNVSQFLRFSN